MSNLDIKAIETAVLSAFKDAFRTIGKDQSQDLAEQSRALAHGLAAIAEALARGDIDTDQAEGLVRSQIEMAKASLALDFGLAGPTIKGLLLTSLGALVGAALNSVGLGVLNGVVQAVIDHYTQNA